MSGTRGVLGLLVCVATWSGGCVIPADDAGLGVIDTGGAGDTDAGPVDADQDGFTSDEDCNDDDPAIHPGAEELCDGIDNDCDGTSDADFDFDADEIADCADRCPVLVDITGDPAATGTHADPYPSVQQGVEATVVHGCIEVRVRPGRYTGNVRFGGLEVDLRSTEGSDVTALVGDFESPVVLIDGGQSALTTVQGFEITEGGGVRGAGIFVAGSDPVISGNHIHDNLTTADLHEGVPAEISDPQQGGGIFLLDSFAEISGNLIEWNGANYGGPEEGSDGGGIFVRSGGPLISRNVIVDNDAGDGGGIWLVRSAAEVLNNLIADNFADDEDSFVEGGNGGQGGGVNIQIGHDDLLFAGNLVTGNVASTHGGGLVVYEHSEEAGSPLILHNTFVANMVSDTEYGAGICGRGATTGRFYNNIVADSLGTQVWLGSGSVFSHNLVHGDDTAFGGEGTDVGTLTLDPDFTAFTDDSDHTNDDLTTGADGLIDAGHEDYTDTDGSAADLGAHGGPHPY